MDLKEAKINTTPINDKNLRRIAVLAFFIIFLIVGLTAYSDYGISWDEPVSRERGVKSLKYVVYGDQDLVNTDWMYHHGAAFEIMLVAVEVVFGVTQDTKSVYLTRHLFTFLLFYIGVIAFYFLCKQSLKSWQAGLMGCLFLVLSPRIFAHSFYNPKDLPFLSLFIIALFSMVAFFNNKTKMYAIIHGFTCALLVDVRSVGAVIPILTIGFLYFDYLNVILKEGNKRAAALSFVALFIIVIAFFWSILPGSISNQYLQSLTGYKSILVNSLALSVVILILYILRNVTTKDEGRAIAAYAILFVLSTAIFTTLFWPILWSNPIGGLIKTFSQTTAFPWPYKVLYMGDFLKANELPWHYLPVWISISTPLLYCFLFLVGYCCMTASFFSNPWHWFLNNRPQFICLGLITAAVGGIILLKPVLYDGWRQMFFIYPLFILIAVTGLWRLLSWSKRILPKMRINVVSILLFSAIGFSLFFTLKTMVVLHPYQNLYFNRLAGVDMDEIKSYYELDYWGVSYRQALEHIVKHDQNAKILLFAENYPAIANVKILDDKDRKRLVFVDKIEDANYFLGNYRWHRGEYPHGSEYFSKKLDGAKIVTVKKIR